MMSRQRDRYDAIAEAGIQRHETGEGVAVANRGMLTRVLINLADNAINLSPSGGEVTIAGELHGGSCFIVRLP